MGNGFGRAEAYKKMKEVKRKTKNEGRRTTNEKRKNEGGNLKLLFRENE